MVINVQNFIIKNKPFQCIPLSTNNLKTQCYLCHQMFYNWWFDHCIRKIYYLLQVCPSWKLPGNWNIPSTVFQKRETRCPGAGPSSGGWLGRGSTNEFLTAQNISDQAQAWPGVGDCSLPWAPRVHTHYRDNSTQHKNGGKYAKKIEQNRTATGKLWFYRG